MTILKYPHGEPGFLSCYCEKGQKNRRFHLWRVHHENGKIHLRCPDCHRDFELVLDMHWDQAFGLQSTIPEKEATDEDNPSQP